MEADDIQRMADRLRVAPSDMALALQAANNDISEAEKMVQPDLCVLKGCYAAKTNRLNGGIVVIIDTSRSKIHRSRVIASYDEQYASIPLDTPWGELEKKIFDAEAKQNIVPAISRDLAAEIEHNLQEDMDGSIRIMTSGSIEELSSRIRRVICGCLGDSDVDIRCAVETLSMLALKVNDHEITPAAPAAPAGEGAAVPEDKHIYLKTDVILSPVSGTPVSALNPGDFILVKIMDNRPQANYIANLLHATDGKRMIPVRVPIRKIERTESQRLVVITEFGPGVFGRTVVQESLKIKVTPEDATTAIPRGARIPMKHIFLIGGIALVVLTMMFAIAWYAMEVFF